jgi:hypothetical protein
MTKEKIAENDLIKMINAGDNMLLAIFSVKTGNFNHFLLIIIVIQRPTLC